MPLMIKQTDYAIAPSNHATTYPPKMPNLQRRNRLGDARIAQRYVIGRRHPFAKQRGTLKSRAQIRILQTYQEYTQEYPY